MSNTQRLGDQLNAQLKQKLPSQMSSDFIKGKFESFKHDMISFLNQTHDNNYQPEKKRFKGSNHEKLISELLKVFSSNAEKYHAALNDIEATRKTVENAEISTAQQVKDLQQLIEPKDNKILDLTSKLREQDKQILDLQNQIRLLKEEEQRKNQEKEMIRNKSQSCDIQVSLETLKDLSTQPLEIKYWSKSAEEIKKIKSSMERSVIIGFQGMQGKGKTFIKNVLGFSSDNNQIRYKPTKGLQINIVERPANNILLIDSSGFDKSYTYEWDEIDKQVEQIENDQILKDSLKYSAMVNQFNQNHIAQKILQHFLLQNSSILIVVVGILTIEEQKLLNQIVNRFITEKSLLVFVIHNFKEYSYIQEVESEIENLQHQFRLDKVNKYLYENSSQSQNVTIFQDQQDDTIQHIIFAKEGTEAGQYYNDFAIDYIRKKIEIYNNVTEQFNLSQKICEFFDKNMKNYISLKPKKDYQEQSKSPKYFKLEEINNEDEKIFVDQIKINSNYEINKFIDSSIDVFGRIKAQFNYSITQYSENERQYKLIEIELPGDIEVVKKPQIKHDYNKQIQEVLITVQKKVLKLNEQSEVITNNRIFGGIVFSITVCMELSTTNDVQEDELTDKGIYRIKLHCSSSTKQLQFSKECLTNE